MVNTLKNQENIWFMMRMLIARLVIPLLFLRQNPYPKVKVGM